MTAQVRAVAFADPTARALYAALYAAFRARRGLLLLHYQHQVRLDEVPWIATLMARAGALRSDRLPPGFCHPIGCQPVSDPALRGRVGQYARRYRGETECPKAAPAP